jgi:magnesium chelatase family protein
MLATVSTATPVAVSTAPVEVEVDLARGLPGFSLVGLPDSAAREGRERIRAALGNQGFEFPARRITVNLAPAALPKRGCAFDLPVAAGILATSGQLPAASLEGWALWGELAFDGRLRPQPGALAVAAGLRESPQVQRLLVPAGCGIQAAAAADVPVYEARDLRQAVAILTEPATTLPCPSPIRGPSPLPDWSGVRAPAYLLEVLELAAAGGHGLLLLGPPGCGKTFMGRRLVDLLPDLSPAEGLEVASIHSSAGLLPPDASIPQRPPLRAPGPGTSREALVGGGRPLRPGEVTLAHHGVLLLDEATELPRATLDGLRGPLVDREVHLSRSHGRARLPARFQLVLTANPCPCGYDGDPAVSCVCRPADRQRVASRLSGPLLDRVDLQLRVARVPLDLDAPATPLAELRERVQRARVRQVARWGAPTPNAEQDLQRLLAATPRSTRHHLAGTATPRAQARKLAVAWTRADLDGRPAPTPADLEAAGRLRFEPMTERAA